jgi:hypothetical protein
MINGVNQRNSEKILFQRHFFQHKCHMRVLEIEAEALFLEASIWLIDAFMWY